MRRQDIAGRLLLGGACAALATGLAAEPALMRNGELRLDELILVTPAEDRYYQNLRMVMRFDGSLRIVQAQLQTLAEIEQVDVEQDPEAGLSLQVIGFTQNPCTSLKPPAIRRQGSTFHVMLAVAAPDPLALCIQMLEPFEQVIPLPTADLEAGDYRVRVNNTQLDFSYEPPPPPEAEVDVGAEQE